jgi:hypothetical protein
MVVDDMNKRELLSVIIKAYNGDRNAAARLVGAALPRLHTQLTDLRQEIQHRHREQWDADEARHLALDPDEEIPPEQTIGAMRDIYQAFLRVAAYTPVMMTADSDEAEALDEMWTDAVFSLVVTLHNPVIRYGLIGGMKPEVREDMDTYLDHLGRELWGTALTLTEPGDIDAEDFPPDVGGIIQAVGESMAEQAEQQRRQPGDD